MVLTTLALATPAVAQTSGQAATAYAVYLVGGINVSTMTIPTPEVSIPELSVSTPSRIGFIGGVLVDVPVHAGVAFETGGLISVKGVTTRLTVMGVGSAEADVRMTYLDVPAHVRVGVAKSNSVTGFLLAGPTLGFRLSARVQGTSDGVTLTESITSDVTAIDLGLTIGGRVQYGRVFGDVRYTWGLIDTVANPMDDVETIGSVKHRVWSFMGGWRF